MNQFNLYTCFIQSITKMLKVKIALIAMLVLATISIYMAKRKGKIKSEDMVGQRIIKNRDAEIDSAIEAIFEINKYHHDRIVDALEEGASESEHLEMLNQKKRDVLQAMRETERNFDIVIDKRDPTEPGPVVVLER